MNQQLPLIRRDRESLHKGLKQSYTYTMVHHLNSPRTMFVKRLLTLGLRQLAVTNDINKFVSIPLRDINQYGALGNKREVLMEDVEKLQNCKFKFKKGDSYKSYVLVPSCEFDAENRVFRMRFNSDLEPILLNFSKRFAYLNVELFLAQSSYSRSRLCEILMFFSDTKVYRCSVEELKSLLGLPENYSWGKIEERVLKPLAEDLKGTPLEHKYRAKKESSRNGKGGRKKVVGVEFYIQGQASGGHRERQSNTLMGLGLTDRQTEIVLDRLDLKLVARTIHQIKVTQMNGNIKSIGAYTWKTFTNIMNPTE